MKKLLFFLIPFMLALPLMADIQVNEFGGVVTVTNGEANVKLQASTSEVSLSSPTAKVEAFINGTIPVSNNVLISIDGKITQCDTKSVSITSGTVTNSDSRYSDLVSSGTSGLITGATTGSIIVSDKVTHFSFIVSDTSGEYTTITPDIWGSAIYLKDSQSDSESIEQPVAITFEYSTVVTSTITYTIRTVK